MDVKRSPKHNIHFNSPKRLCVVAVWGKSLRCYQFLPTNMRYFFCSSTHGYEDVHGNTTSNLFLKKKMVSFWKGFYWFPHDKTLLVFTKACDRRQLTIMNRNYGSIIRRIYASERRHELKIYETWKCGNANATRVNWCYAPETHFCVTEDNDSDFCIPCGIGWD